jgi:hypothetical protein
VVVRVRRAEVVDLAQEERWSFDVRHAVQRGQLVEAAVDCALGRRTVIADDQIDQRVIEDIQIFEHVHQATDVMIGLLEEPRVDLHLAGQDRLEVGGHLIPSGDLLVTRRQLGVRWDYSELLLSGNRLLP